MKELDLDNLLKKIIYTISQTELYEEDHEYDEEFDAFIKAIKEVFISTLKAKMPKEYKPGDYVPENEYPYSYGWNAYAKEVHKMLDSL